MVCRCLFLVVYSLLFVVCRLSFDVSCVGVRRVSLVVFCLSFVVSCFSCLVWCVVRNVCCLL